MELTRLSFLLAILERNVFPMVSLEDRADILGFVNANCCRGDHENGTRMGKKGKHTFEEGDHCNKTLVTRGTGPFREHNRIFGVC